MNSIIIPDQGEPITRPARVGFLGVGWIGRHRMEAMLATGLVEAAAIADPSPEMVQAATKAAPQAKLLSDLDELLALDLDGVVIATPSAQHAEQTIRALNAGVAVFCQKPLGRTAREVKAVVEAARTADRVIGVDLSYRHTEAMQRIKALLKAQHLGQVSAIDLTFHNAYGPDKPWFYDKKLSGGGCVIDLGVHLIDLALWALDFPDVIKVTSNLLARGRPLSNAPEEVEDYAVATLLLATGAVVRLACSWRLHAGQDCIIDASFYGTAGGAAMRNVGGSFYDFVAQRFSGTVTEQLADQPDEWGGRAATAWARQLVRNRGFDPEAEHLVRVAEVIDQIYANPYQP
ncbi:Gfo/Idh/MocA family oxidoreductase [Rhizobium sp. XQZ8]|uniref:Gfo/Idh/MocA family protein n=1 Tax=Rhizobium populisoli TaxID=2859785 RepID=UPI001C662E9F|nr:Gfo/Idh/MocA family oxidoreductase [Rhizobium populisoli]MBW6424874.1 Gfo/Idh/MocA family oxidoreductase [Rhizobium populisoli]